MKKNRISNPMKTGLQIFLLLAILSLNMGPIGSSTAYAAAPSNDDWASAFALTDANVPFSQTVNVDEADTEAGEPQVNAMCDGKLLALGNNSVWYKYTSATTKFVSFDTVGSLDGDDELDTYMAIWTGNDINSLTFVGCDDDNDVGFTSQFAFSAQAGTNYYVQIAKYNGVQGGTPDTACILNDGCKVTFNVKLNFQTFVDVPPTHPYFQYIEALYAGGYTNGCSAVPLKYCPNSIMNRAQIAKFFMTTEFGGSYLPPANTPLKFKDSWKINPWAKLWANDMYDKGLTNGCKPSPLLYCPDRDVIREEVAKFGLAIKYGNAYEPTASGTVFADLTDPGYWATGWAEQAYADGLVPACGSAGGKPKFCPYGKVDRGFAAFVIVKATGLLGP